ncbi:phosphoinositide phosphatase [Niveomyces insectorum RCEF 264]|uniref:phosphoinositide 5-phosphatase n=1 Tax=Niveomyces insectorum RCEF 264 TaxID=1081102 RepID=A0A167ZAT3_9HYPO|nr:phosphoinositide phosphatase [Niveomyces insectorum RCEF 264]
MDYLPSTLPWNGQAPDPDKSCQLLIRDYPHRAMAIVSRSHALVFRHSSNSGHDSNNNHNSGSTAGASRVMVEFTPTSKGMLSDYRPLTPRPVYGTLGLISVNRDVFLCVITQALRVATLRPGETIEMIQQVQFFCLNSNEYDDVLSLDPWDPDGDAASAYGQGLSRREVPLEHPCQELMKILGNRSFYYSTDFDITNRLQERSADASTFDIDNFDESFLWNSFMIQPLVQFRARLQPHERDALDASRILTSAIRGFCLTVTIPQSAAPLRTTRSGMPSYLTVISRLSCRRAGTRFNSRGIDDDGNVANFVETETIYWSPAGVAFSYVQVRGSVPVFWEQSPGLIPGHQKITVTRSPDGAQPAFDKHFEDLETSYGAVHVLNLLSEAKPGEAELSQCYRYGLQHCPLSQRGEKAASDHALLRSTEYDFHAETRGPTGYEAAQEIRKYIENSADGFAYYLAVESEDGNTKDAQRTASFSGGHRRFIVVLQQEGVFRTNCLDCLDRTNLIQTIISQMAVEAFLHHRGEYAATDFWVRHSNLWADNGDALSKIYAGTGALKSSFTRHGKMSLAGAFADARKSATRLYINNFADKGRQNTIDMLLGRLYGQAPVVLFDPISDYVTAELNKRSATFSSSKVITIWVGTFNLNGRIDGLEEDLSPWLFPTPILSAELLPEILAVGFQEIVELSPQQIMNSDPSRKQQWETVVRKTLNRHAASVGGEPYVLLRSGQLVGAALCIFVKASSLAQIKNVEGSVKKTGMSGMAGNKGAVGIRLDYAGTPICFVTAHLAAGFANYEERNKDYSTIHHGLRFQRNRRIDNHDAVIWFGDFNYRIGLSRERAMELVKAGDLESLYENDQLNLQMVAGLAFPYYSEARITFPPTYKFDVGRDEYDSSEKQRIPAWTDRILRKGSNLRQADYHCAPLRFSDHRPVYAHFACTVTIVDETLRDKISSELYEQRKADVGDATANTAVEDTDDEDLVGYDAIEPGLPAASSDRQKWWLDNGRMAQAAVQPPAPANPATHATVLNPHRPANPFVPTDEPDWVAVPRAEHVNHSSVLSSSANSQGKGGAAAAAAAATSARKLPPPYDPSAVAAVASASPAFGMLSKTNQPAGQSLSAQFYQPTAGAAPPPPPPPRRQTAGVSGGGTAAAPNPRTASTVSLPTAAPVSSAAAYSIRPNAPTVSGVARAFGSLRTPPSPSPPASNNNNNNNNNVKTTVQKNGDHSRGPPLPPSRKSGQQSASHASSADASPLRPQSAASNKSAAAPVSPAASALTGKPKPAPPVAKKPAHLTATPSPKGVDGIQDMSGDSRNGMVHIPSPSAPPKPPRRKTDVQAASAVGAAVGGALPPPKHPSYTPTAAHSTTIGGGGVGTGRKASARPVAAEPANAVDLLGDDANSELSRWQPLQPS